MRSVNTLLRTLGALLLSSCFTPGARDACRVVVGENVQVTDSFRDGPYLYMMEPTIATNPTNIQNLLVSGMARGARPLADEHPRDVVVTYVSTDSGRSWHRTLTVADYDPGTVFNASGTALSSASSGFWRSTDSGETWLNVDDVPEWDRPNLAADLASPRRGAIYFSGLGIDHAGRHILYFAQSRDGNTWTESTYATVADVNEVLSTPHQRRGLQAHESVLISQSGVVTLPFYSWTLEVGRATERSPPLMTPLMTRSEDGGRTFSRPSPLVRQQGETLFSVHHSAIGRLQFAMDSSGGAHDGRIYLLWVEHHPNQRSTLQFAHSDDGGHIWSDPRTVETLDNPRDVLSGRDGSYRDVRPTLPIAQVNDEGVLLLSWYRFNDGSAGRVDHQRFVTASLDGGRHFLPTQPLASFPTRNYWGPRTGAVDTANGDLGHYLKLVSDAQGIFHAVWMDGRTGRHELWYAPVSVECDARSVRS